MSFPLSLRGRALSGIAALAVTAGVTAVAVQAVTRTPVVCPPGYVRVADAEREIAPDRLDPALQGPRADFRDVLRNGCIPRSGPESFTDLALRDVQQSSVRTAPFDRVAPGALRAAAEQRRAMMQEPAPVPGNDGQARPYGRGPLIFDDPRFGEGNGTGIIDSTGRIDEFEYDAATNRLFAAIGTGGVWLSEDVGDTWRPITDNMPTTVASSVAYSSAGGPDGTVVVLSGEHTYGGSSYVGIGAYWSDDLGATWNRADGVPDGVLGFAIEVDPANPERVYAATGQGLYRSTDAGRTYVDVVLPTGRCAGDYNTDTCLYANFVTDVVVQEPGGSTEVAGGTVVAAVGWRAGTKENPDGTIQSEGNGVYRSDDGSPGTFARLDGLDAVAGGQERLGRMEFGPATGPEQDHGYLYAILEDAVLFNGGPAIDPLPGGGATGTNPTVLSGVYVSPDFGESWTELADDQELSDTCPVNRSVYCIPGLIEPGAQSWYNMWITPDPTKQVGGVPSRVLFGLEEVWQSRANQIPQNTPLTSFEVIGAYYGGADCLLAATNCGVNREAGVTTTHPDQHHGIMIPGVGEDGEPDGTVRLLVGHDGGLSRQNATQSDDFDQRSWELDQENGLETLLPYSSVWANDGVAYAGLQDNGNMRVDPAEDFAQYETIGADGTFSAVDPANSDYAWESTQNAGYNVTIDGGKTWRPAPMPDDNIRFVNPYVMDPLDSNHLVSGGKVVYETLSGPDTANGEEGTDWIAVFDLGTAPAPDGPPTIDQPEAPNNGLTAVDTRGDVSYVGFCGVCDILNSPFPFRNGIATNVGTDVLPEKGTDKGWHFATAEGLPNRFITSIAIDPLDATQETIYVTLGGYSRRWVPPGSNFDENPELGEGHVYKSTDAGETFTDISGNLPDVPALWVEPRGEQLLLGTDLGAYISSDTEGGDWAVFAPGQLPATPVTSIQLKPDDPNKVLLGLYGRGLWIYEFPEATGVGPEIRRLSGSGRIQTAIAISQDAFESATTVVLARDDEYADALAGAPLAFRENAPMLLTLTEGLNDDVAAEIQRLGATRAVLLGGEGALSPQVEDDLRAAGVTDIERYSGQNRFSTAGAIAGELGGTTVYITKGNDPDRTRGWPDAMSIAPVAAKQQQAILLVETDRIPAETTAALDSLGANKGRIVGGPGAVSTTVETELAQRLELAARVAGPDRFATSVAAAEVGESAGLSAANTWLARGGDFPDALSAGPSVAAAGGVLVLVSERDLEDSPASRTFLEERGCGIEIVRLLGGTVAISQNVADQVTAIFEGCGAGVPDAPDPSPVPGEPIAGPVGPQPEGEVLAGPFGFEADAEEWTVARSGNPTTSWSRGEGGASESTTSFQVAPYNELAGTTLTSPELTSPGGRVFVSWQTRYDVEGGGFDEYVLEFSVDGEEWAPLATFGGQNFGYPEWTGARVTFMTEPGPFFVRYRFYSDEICSSTATTVPGLCARPDGYEGAFVDEIVVER